MEQRRIGARVARARTALGLTQSELAARLGVSRSTLAEMETGQRKVTADELYKLGDLLHRRLDYFFSEAEPQPQPTALRAGSEDLTEQAREALVHLDGMLANIRDLEELAGTPLHATLVSYDPSQKRSPAAAGEYAAAAERKRLGLGQEPVADLRAVLERRVGIPAFCYYVASGTFSGAFQSDGEHAAILLNVAHLTGHNNFTLAHEYAHALVSRGAAHVEMRTARKTPEERFCDSFAAWFLMPPEAIDGALRALGTAGGGLNEDHLLVLASQFGVSFSAMLGRLEHFGLIDRSRGDDLRRSTRPSLRSRQLGLPDQRQQAECLPESYRQMAFWAFHKGAMTRSRLAEYLQTDFETAYDQYAAWAAAVLATREGGGARAAAG